MGRTVVEGKKPSHLLFHFSHVSRRQDLQEMGMMARFWYNSWLPFIGLGALVPTASSLRGFQQVQCSLPGPLGADQVQMEQKYLRLLLCRSLHPAVCLLYWAQ